MVYGRSLGGFDVDCDVGSERIAAEDEDGRESSSRLYGLSEQIEFMERQLGECVRRWRDGDVQGKKKEKVKVILIGHSVGAYVAMEILRRWREEKDDGTMEIIGGIMLFPTVVDIAKSISGRKLTVRMSFTFKLHLHMTSMKGGMA